jgi:hypothetical protein
LPSVDDERDHTSVTFDGGEAAVGFACRGLLVVPVPVAGAYAAHRNFSPVFLPKS